VSCFRTSSLSRLLHPGSSVRPTRSWSSERNANPAFRTSLWSPTLHSVWPADSPPSEGDLTYTRRNGRFFLEIVGHPEFGVPFGQDRLVLLWLATQAVRNKSPVVEFGSAAEILNEWRLPTNGVYYRRLTAAFKRVFTSTIFFGTRDDRRRSEVWNCSRSHFFDHVQLWFDEDITTGMRRQNLVTLSASFWDELKSHPIPVDADVVRELANNPGCLDLYTWLTWRCYQVSAQVQWGTGSQVIGGTGSSTGARSPSIRLETAGLPALSPALRSRAREAPLRKLRGRSRRRSNRTVLAGSMRQARSGRNGMPVRAATMMESLP
jgi:hypothetical protein